MKKWKHISYDQRKVINNLLTKKSRLNEIAVILGLDPTSISKEIKRNRVAQHPFRKLTNKECVKLHRYPYVCNSCSLKYSSSCPFDKYKYDPKHAESKATQKLILSRRCLDISSKEFNDLDEAIKSGVENDNSIYHISKTDERVTKSISTIYRYINNGYLTTKRVDLPSAVTYKKRKSNKKYDYSTNKIDRSNHIYINYLAYKNFHQNEFSYQLDFLGKIKSDSKHILTLIIPDLHFTILKIMKNPNASKVTSLFNEIETELGLEDFKKVFPSGLTDRDPCFSDIDGFELSCIDGSIRTNIFYCDPYVSNQKPSVENMNKQIRKYFLKGKSIDKYTKEDIRRINIALNKKVVRSLDGQTPETAFITVYGIDIFHKLFK